MGVTGILSIIVVYFLLLIIVSFLTGKSDSNEVFFNAKKQSPWYIVAFGMIGATLSGITFVSVPGWVESSGFGYMQMTLGYVVGYTVIARVLLPLYYKLNLTSIYTYLERRYGVFTYKTGAIFFLISRTIGASFRLFLVANILQLLFFDSIGVPFWLTVIVTILLIWVYTFRSGIKTIVWTDTLQTVFMLIALFTTIVAIYDEVITTSFIDFFQTSSHAQIFFFEDVKSPNYFWKQFFGGMFIAIAMMGLDQDIMQKSLTCKNLKDAQKNVYGFTIALVIINFIFLFLGLMLVAYAQKHGIDAHNDALFPSVVQEYSGTLLAVFLIGLVASAYSSADSALTSLTTSYCVDILGIKVGDTNKSQRKKVHLMVSVCLAAVIILFKYTITDQSLISQLFLFASYTYGPLLGLYAFGLFTKIKIRDKVVPIIALITPILGYTISWFLENNYGFQIGFFVLVLNGFLMALGVYLFKVKCPV